MASSKDSAGQSPLPAVPSPLTAAAVPDSDLSLPIRTRDALDSAQTITPPQEEDAPQQPVYLNQIDKLQADLKAYLSGQYLQFADKPREYILPVSAYDQLFPADLDSESDRELAGFRISYDFCTSILTVFTMPTSRRNDIIAWLLQIAEKKLDSSVRRKLKITFGSVSLFEGEWEQSEKAADLDISWSEHGLRTELHTVVEVGVSQSRQSLLNVRDMYLKGTSQVSRFVLVNVITNPEYRSPEELDIDELSTIREPDFQFDPDLGPLWYKGIPWVGKTTLVWEAWERGLENGEPKQIFSATIDPSDSETRLPFFEIPTTIAKGAEAVTVGSTDVHELYSHRLGYSIFSEAETRMRRYVRGVNKRRKREADLAEQKDAAAKKRSKANEERTERWRRRSGR